MQRIGVVLAVILLVPVIATSAALLMGWPIRDKLFYLNIGWVFAWVVCYLGARAVVWLIARWVRAGSKSD